MFYNWSKYGIEIPNGRSHGQIRTLCPQCSASRHKSHDKCLSVNLDKGIFHCHNCGFVGYVGELEEWEKEERNEQWKKEHQSRKKNKQQVEYKLPTKIGNSEYSESVLKYFSEERHISEETLKEMKVTEGLEYMPQSKKERRTIQFNYFLDGVHVNTKYRTREKEFKGVTGARLVPYNIDAIKYTDECIITEGECFHPSAEVLTGSGWKRLDCLCGTEEVAQYNQDGTIDFVKPLAYVTKPFEGNLVEFTNKRNNFYSLTTPKHNLVVLKEGKPCKIHADSITTLQQKIPRNGYFDGVGLDIDDNLIRLYVAISADFTIRKGGDLYAAFKKGRKTERIEMLCNYLGLRYSARKDKRGYDSVFIHRGQGLTPFKEYPMRWLSQMSRHQIDLMLSEIVFWDGNSVKGRTMKEYNTKLIHNAVFVQTLCHIGGKMSTICHRSNEYGEWYKVTILDKTFSVTNSYYRNDIYYKGYVYCVTMPSGMLLVRQNNNITISGNCDALSFYEIGLHNVISVPSGSKNLAWVDEFIDDYFANKTTIYIASDTDTPGVEMKDELIRRFGADRCKIVTYNGCKDANELLVKEGKAALMQAYEDAQDAPIDGVFSVNDLKSDLDALYDKGWKRGVTIGLSDFDKLCSFEVGRICIVTGIPTSGKSEFVDFMTVMLNRRYGWKTVYFSPENFPITYHIAKLSEKLIGKPFSKERENRMSRDEYEVAAEYINDNFFFVYPNDNCQVENVLEKAKAFVHRKGCKIVVLDPYNRLDHGSGSERETVYISKFLDKLTYFAQQNMVLVILVAHPTKLPKNKEGFYDPPTLYDISGSSAFYAKADFGITIHRDKMEGCVLAISNKVKFKHLGDLGTAKLKYNINNGRYVGYEFGSPMNWDNSNYLKELMPANYVEQDRGGFVSQIQPNEGFYSQPQQQEETYFIPQEPSDETPPF